MHKAEGLKAAHTLPPAAAKLNPPYLLAEQRMVAPLTRRFHRHVSIQVECAKGDLIITAIVYSEITQGLVLLFPLLSTEKYKLYRKVS